MARRLASVPLLIESQHPPVGRLGQPIAVLESPIQVVPQTLEGILHGSEGAALFQLRELPDDGGRWCTYPRSAMLAAGRAATAHLESFPVVPAPLGVRAGCACQPQPCPHAVFLDALVSFNAGLFAPRSVAFDQRVNDANIAIAYYPPGNRPHAYSIISVAPDIYAVEIDGGPSALVQRAARHCSYCGLGKGRCIHLALVDIGRAAETDIEAHLLDCLQQYPMEHQRASAPEGVRTVVNAHDFGLSVQVERDSARCVLRVDGVPVWTNQGPAAMHGHIALPRSFGRRLRQEIYPKQPYYPRPRPSVRP